MFSVFTSYLPPLPSLGLPLSLPSNLQPRLLRFLLRKAVGRFVRGGLNLEAGQQVEADLGRGSVAVRALELDAEAVAPFLEGLPIEFVSGTIGQVSAQVDWPLSFSSGVAISLDQLSLVLAIKPPSAQCPPSQPHHSNPEQSDPLSAAASEFVHDDLSPKEDAELRASLLLEPSVSDLGGSVRLPGSFGGQERDEVEEEEQGQEVTLLASLIAGLLARLKVRVQSVRVRLVLPAEEGQGEVELELKVDSIAYADEPLAGGNEAPAFRRTVRMSPPVVSLRLPTPPPPPHGATPTRSRSSSTSTSEAPSTRRPSLSTSQMGESIPSIPSPQDSPHRQLHALSPPRRPARSDSDSSSSSDGSLGPEHDMMMSQSIADMRTSFASARSGGESLYASALGGTMGGSRMDALDERGEEDEDDPFFDPDSNSPSIAIQEDGPPRPSQGGIAPEDPFDLREDNAQTSPPPAEQDESPSEPLTTDNGFRTILSFGHDELILVLSPQSTSAPTQLSPPSPSPEPSTANPPPSLDPTLSSAPLSPARSLSPASPALPSTARLGSAPEVVPPIKRRAGALAVSATISGAVAGLLLPAQLAGLVRIGNALAGSGTQQTAPLPAAAKPTPASAPSELSISCTLKAIHLVVGLSPTIDSLPMELVDSFFAHPSATSISPAHLHLRLKLEGLSLSVEGGTTHATLRAFALTEALFDGSTRPLAVSDPNLTRQYEPEDEFPRFEGADWVGDKTAEARGWRLKAAQVARGRRLQREVDKPALAVELAQGSTTLKVGAVHLFADLTVLHRLMPFVEFVQSVVPASRAPQPGSTAHAPVQPLTPATPQQPASSSKPTPSVSDLSVSCEIVRVSVRVPSPAAYAGPIRSGIATLDVHNLAVRASSSGTTLDLHRLGAFFLPSANSHAVGFLALARLPNSAPSVSLPSPADPLTSIHLPLLLVRLDKPTLDGLQLFVDDLGQWSSERAVGSPTPTEVERGPRASGGDAKILGSAYFGASRRRAMTEGSESSDEAEPFSDRGNRIKVSMSEVFVEFLVGRKDSGAVSRLRAKASEVEVGVHTGAKEEGDLLLDLQIAQAAFEDASDGQPVQRYLERTSPQADRSLPLVKLVFSASVEKETGLKESKIQLTLAAFTYFLTPDLDWTKDLARFAKAPAGAFETVVPNELTRVRLRILEGSVHVSPPHRESRLVLALGEVKLATNLMPDLPRTRTFIELAGVRALAIDSAADLVEKPSASSKTGAEHWKRLGFVQLLDLDRCALEVRQGNGLVLPDLELEVLEAKLSASLCADSLASVQALAADFSSALPPSAEKVDNAPTQPERRVPQIKSSADLLASVDGAAFSQAASFPDAPEDLDDDVPTNFDYLADALQQGDTPAPEAPSRKKPTGERAGVLVSDIGGETIRMLDPRGLVILDDFLAEPRVDPGGEAEVHPASVVRCRLSRCEVAIHIHEGYDWATTRSAIAAEAKAVRKRLEKIRQLLASGQKPDASAEHASVLLFGSVSLGLPPGASELPGPQLLAAIEDELDRNAEEETVVGVEMDEDGATEAGESWQSLPKQASSSTTSPRPARAQTSGKNRRRLTRAKHSAIEVVLNGINASFDSFPSSYQKSSSLKVEVEKLEILDHLRTSTWRKFLTELRASDGGVVRASEASMVRFELDKVWPSRGGREKAAQEELVMKIKIFPLRLYVDQDALDFLKAFGAFKMPLDSSAPPAEGGGTEPFFQRVEILPVKIKLDYKPKRVDYHALRRGKTAELMNFFHFDGSELTLRHLVVTGISGGTRLSELVQDIWTPDVTSHQLADVISGIAPVRSVVNVGAGVANLVLLPIEQYRKDGRLVRGLQKGAQAFAKQTTIEALSVGARLATGTQGLLEQAEGLLNPARSSHTAGSSSAAVGVGALDASAIEGSVVLTEEERRELISRYAQQPGSLRGGLEEAYKSLGTNLREAAQTILAVPMEVYERSGSEGPVRAVVRAVPIAVLRPMIGGAEAMSKALFGLRNELDPEAVREAEVKYKPRGGGGANV